MVVFTVAMVSAMHRLVMRCVVEGYARILALTTGIETFANLVAACDGTSAGTMVAGSGASRTMPSVAASEGCSLIMMATRGRGTPKA
jgi:hypothetical protein